MANLQIAVELFGKDSASGPISAVHKGLTGLAGAATAPLGALGALGSAFGNVAQIAGGFALGGGLMSLPGFLQGAAQAAAEDEASTLRLSRTIQNMGGDYDEIMGKVNGAIESGQKLAFSDDDVRNSFQFLAQATGDSDEALKRQKLAMDLSRGANIPLSQATKMLGKLTDENIQVFKKMGIVMKDGATEAEVLAEVQKRFGGQSEAYANSTAGQFEQAKIAMSETVEAIGGAVLPILARLGKVLTDVLPGVQAFVGGLSTGISEKVGPVLDKLGTVFSALFAAFTKDAGAIGIIGDVIKDTFGEGVYNAIQPFLQAFMDAIPQFQQFGRMVGQVFATFGEIIGAVFGGDLARAGSLLDGFLTETLGEIGDNLALWGGAFLAWIGPMIPPLLQQLIGLYQQMSTWMVGTALPAVVKTLGSWAGAFIDWVGPLIPPLLRELGSLLVQFGGWILGTALPMLVKNLAEWGAALVGWIAPRIGPLLLEVGTLIAELGLWLITTALPKLLGWAGDLGLGLVRGIVDAVANLGKALGKALADAIRSIRIDIGPFHLSSEGFTIDVPRLPAPIGNELMGFATGGIVPGPRNAPQLAIVHGGERIIPTVDSGAEGWGSGLAIHFHAPVYGMDDFQSRLEEAFRRFQGGMAQSARMGLA